MTPMNLSGCAHEELAIALGAVRGGASITADWELLQAVLHGVKLRQVRASPKTMVVLVEIWRGD